jgi:hypothetical protein
MATYTRTRRRGPAQFVAIGLPPEMVGGLMDRLDEEGATPVRVEHDDEGTALVFFQLASWDSGSWLTSVAQQFGCGLAPCRTPT